MIPSSSLKILFLHLFDFQIPDSFCINFLIFSYLSSKNLSFLVNRKSCINFLIFRKYFGMKGMNGKAWKTENYVWIRKVRRWRRKGEDNSIIQFRYIPPLIQSRPFPFWKWCCDPSFRIIFSVIIIHCDDVIVRMFLYFSSFFVFLFFFFLVFKILLRSVNLDREEII